MHYAMLILAALVGCIAGTASGALGIGGGVLLVPMFLMILGLPMKEAVGTSLVCLVAYGMVGAGQHLMYGNVRWRVFALVVPLGLLGSYFGAYLAEHVPATPLKRALGFLLLLVGLKLFFLPDWPVNPTRVHKADSHPEHAADSEHTD